MHSLQVDLIPSRVDFDDGGVVLVALLELYKVPIALINHYLGVVQNVLRHLVITGR
jgi:hypothetical protein